MRNLLADPRVRVRVGEASFAAVARVVVSTAQPDLHAAVQVRSREKYGWGDGLVVELDPVRTKS